MKELKTIIADPQKRKEVVADCVALLESEVKSKGGLGGMAVKVAYAVVKAIKPGIIPNTVDGLLDEFVDALQPFFEKYQQESSQAGFGSYIGPRANDVAEALLHVTDKRAQRSKIKIMVSSYQKLRPKGKTHVEQSVPGLGRLLDKHITN